MDDLLNYEKRDQLYQFLLNDFGATKVKEKYYEDSFGDFIIVLSVENFPLRYDNDRHFLTVDIANKSDPEKWYALSFIRDFIYNPEKINADKRDLDNKARIEELNDFLKKDFNLINSLFTKERYPVVKQKIDEGLKLQFKINFPEKKNVFSRLFFRSKKG